MLGSRDLEDISDAKESFLSIPIGDGYGYGMGMGREGVLSIPVGDDLNIRGSSIQFFQCED